MGTVELTIRRLGYSAARIAARVAAGQNEVTMRLDGASVTLDEMRIVGNQPVLGRHDDFEMRMRVGIANGVVTRADLEKLRPILLSQMLRRLPGVRVADSSGSTVLISQRGFKIDKNRNLVPCVLRVMIDGTLSSSSNIDALPPTDVYGVELFLGPARIPPQLEGLRDDGYCGLVAIWTR